MTIETKSRKVPEKEVSPEFRTDLTKLLEDLEESEHLDVSDAIIFSSGTFRTFLANYRESIVENTVSTLKHWMEIELTYSTRRMMLSADMLECRRRPVNVVLARMLKENFLISALLEDEELDAAASNLLNRAKAESDEEVAADLRRDAADLCDPTFREAILRSRLAQRDPKMARELGLMLSPEELDAELEGDNV